MLFNSFIFLFFLIIVLSVFYSLKNQLLKKYWLLLSSFFFYGYFNIELLGVLILCILFNYYIALFIRNSKTGFNHWLTIGVIFNLLILAYFKYLNFFVDSFIEIIQILGFKSTPFYFNIILPIGISFYIFKSIAYLVDVSKNEVEPTKNIVNFALYLSFFPQLIAGPIQRANYIFPQLSSSLTPTKTQLKDAFFLISIGLFQKTMIGDACGKMVDAIFFDLSKYSSFEIISAVLLFTFQIYADFAGYSNIARGLAKLFGLELTINFKQPYYSKNIKEFWRKWHISLSTWLRDYLYFPLGGNRKGKLTTYRNILIVMLLGGLWHGAGWNFILWGLYHALLLIVYDFTKSISLPKYLNYIITFICVVIGWGIFRLNDISHFTIFVEQVAVMDLGNFYWRFVKMILTYGGMLLLIDWLQIKYKNDAIFSDFKNQYFAFGITISLFLVSLLYILTKDSSPFIYFQF